MEDDCEMGGDLSDIVKGWDYDATDERANVRLIDGDDGVLKVQLRVRFGVLQLYVDGTPESGGESQLDVLRRDLAAYRARKGSGKGFEINTMRTALASQEIMDYYQRRVCFFILADYRRAMRDAQHNLDLMELLRDHSVDEETVLNHDRYRAFVMMDRARAAAMLAVEQVDTSRAISQLDEEIQRIKAFYQEHPLDDVVETSKELEVLYELKRDLRKDYHIPLSHGEEIELLREEQVRAIAREDYEKAARLRDEIAGLEKHLGP